MENQSKTLAQRTSSILQYFLLNTDLVAVVPTEITSAREEPQTKSVKNATALYGVVNVDKKKKSKLSVMQFRINLFANGL